MTVGLRSRARMRLGQSVYIGVPQLQVDVRLSVKPDSHLISFDVRVQPQGGTARPARQGEVLCMVQNKWVLIWQTIDQAETNNSGYANILKTPPLNPGRYRASAKHQESGAEYAYEFDVLADYTAGNWGPRQQVDAGSQLVGFSQSRPTKGLAFPEDRQWPLSGPNLALPGVKVRVRQVQGPGLRQPKV